LGIIKWNYQDNVIVMIGYELIKEFYKISDETGKNTKYTHICGIVDNDQSRDEWLAKVTPLNTYHVKYGYHTIKEI